MNIALIFAGGVGKRMNSKGKPKQFLMINGKPILLHTIEIFENHPQIDAIILVSNADWIDYTQSLIQKFGITKVKWIVKGGESGQESIANGLRKLSEEGLENDDTIVLIHDGVRPLINEDVITRNIEAVHENGNAITVAPAYETIIRADEKENLCEVYERSMCRLARAPQSFYLKDILNAHRKVNFTYDDSIVDSATLMSKNGKQLHLVNGPLENIKITTPSDFYVFRAFLEAKENSQIWGI